MDTQEMIIKLVNVRHWLNCPYPAQKLELQNKPDFNKELSEVIHALSIRWNKEAIDKIYGNTTETGFGNARDLSFLLGKNEIKPVVTDEGFNKIAETFKRKDSVNNTFDWTKCGPQKKDHNLPIWELYKEYLTIIDKVSGKPVDFYEFFISHKRING